VVEASEGVIRKRVGLKDSIFEELDVKKLIELIFDRARKAEFVIETSSGLRIWWFTNCSVLYYG